jgi:hypothetical protein
MPWARYFAVPAFDLLASSPQVHCAARLLASTFGRCGSSTFVTTASAFSPARHKASMLRPSRSLPAAAPLPFYCPFYRHRPLPPPPSPLVSRLPPPPLPTLITSHPSSSAHLTNLSSSRSRSQAPPHQSVLIAHASRALFASHRARLFISPSCTSSVLRITSPPFSPPPSAPF